MSDLKVYYMGDVNPIEYGGMWIIPDCREYTHQDPIKGYSIRYKISDDKVYIIRVDSWSETIGRRDALAEFGSEDAVRVETGMMYVSLRDRHLESALEYCGIEDDVSTLSVEQKAEALVAYGGLERSEYTFKTQREAARMVADEMYELAETSCIPYAESLREEARKLLKDYPEEEA